MSKRSETERLCVSCRQMKPREQLLRIARCGQTVLPDSQDKMQGRGAYVCLKGSCLQQALGEGRLARSLHCSISAEAQDLILKTWEQLQNNDVHSRILNLLGLGRRSRRLVVGTQAAELAIRKKQAYLVILSNDCASNTRKQFESLCKQMQIPCFFFSTGEELGNLFGAGSARRVVALTDEELYKGLYRLLEENQEKRVGGVINYAQTEP